MMELKIISDGTPTGTKIVDSKTGEQVEGISSIEWSIKYGEFAVAKIELESCCAELVTRSYKVVKPKKKEIEVKKKTFELLPSDEFFPDVDDVPF